MKRLWAWIVDPAHQKALAFLGGGLVAVIGGGWTVYQEFFKSAPPSPVRAVENACAVGVAGGDVTISGVSCTFGISLAEYEAALAQQEEKLRAELETATEDAALRLSLAQALSATQTRLADVEAAFEERSAAFKELAQALEAGTPDPEIGEIFKDAVETGDTSGLEARLRADLGNDLRGVADRSHQLGILLRQQGKFVEAHEAFQRAAQMVPDNPAFQEAVTELAGRLDVALRGRIRVTAVLAEGGDALYAGHAVYEPEADLDGKRTEITRKEGAAVWFELPPGAYWVASWTDKAYAAREVQVVADQERNAVVVLDAGRLRLSAVLGEGGEPVYAGFAIYEPQTDLDGNRREIIRREGEAQWFTLPAGTYWVASWTDKAYAAREVEVAAGKDNNEVILLNAGRLRLSAALAEGGEAVHAGHAVYEPQTDLDGNRREIIRREGTANWFTLPAGPYWVASWTDKAYAARAVEVVAGEDANEVILLDAGRLRMSAVLGVGGEPVEAAFAVYEPDADLDGKRREIIRREGTAKWFTLPAGPYWVASWTDKAYAARRVEVIAGQDANEVIVLDAGRLRMSVLAEAGGEPVEARHVIYELEADLDGNRREIIRREGTAKWFTLPAGTYYVVSSAGDRHVAREATVVANQDTNLVLTFP